MADSVSAGQNGFANTTLAAPRDTDARRSSHGGLAEANSNDQLLNGPTHSSAPQSKANGINDSSSLPPSKLSNEKAAMTNKDIKKEIPGGNPSDVKKEKKPGPDKNVDLDEHLLTLDQLCDRYKTHVNNVKPGDSVGLNSEEAKRRLLENGPNALSPPKRVHPIVKFLKILLGLFNAMLILSGIIAYALYGAFPSLNQQNVYLGAILIGVAFLNAAVEFIQIQKSQAILESFLNLIPQKCFVIRDGKLQNIGAVDLVIGDVVFFRLGDKIPADLCLFASTDLKVDNSSLTGEADPQERSAHNSSPHALEANNLVFNGTLAVNGEGYGIVIRTGDRTVIGQIASLTANEEKRASPLSNEIEYFVKTIASIAFVVALVFFLVALVGQHYSISVSLNFAIGTFVAFVPEGLPATVTVLLTIAAKRMAARNVLVKDLQGVETLGSITLLATDKTGTLTRNQMTVTFCWTGGPIGIVPGGKSGAITSAAAVGGHQMQDLDDEGFKEVLYISALCSKAKFDRTDVPMAERQILGDATEAGLLRCAAAKLEDYDGLTDKFPKVFEVPFNSENKWHMSIHKKSHANGPLTLYIKGAPERVLRLCSHINSPNGPIPLDEEQTKRFEDTYKFMASKGHRVLAFAYKLLDGNEYPENHVFSKDPPNYPKSNLTFLGLVSLEDPPKHGVREAIGHCREAGIKVMMVTGDHPLTAEAIGRKINLMIQDTKQLLSEKTGRPLDSIREDEYHAIVVHGETIDSLTDEDWDRIFSKEEIIFARTSPKHKLQIVKRAQSHGHIVGVTGDGVNDSPALKKADLGIAMNQSGSDVSKEAAAMILLDDNFASTVAGIEEGRLIFSNLKKSIQYTVSHTMPEVYANLFFIVVPLPLPLSTVQILVIDLGFELPMALSYAYDPPENRTGLMKLAPRKPVTEKNIAIAKRKELEKREKESKRHGGDMEQGKNDLPSWRVFLIDRWDSFKSIFTKKYWRERFEDTDDEILVDANLMSWSYLEAGSIISIGCFVVYFVTFYYYTPLGGGSTLYLTPSFVHSNAQNWGTSDLTAPDGRTLTVADQNDALAQAQSAYYLSIMFIQIFNLFICKARLGYPFGKFMFQNRMTAAGILFGVIISMFIVYVPPVNIAFQTSYRYNPLYWLISIAFGFGLLGYACLRIWFLRRYKPIRFTDEIQGLQMFPTRWSTGR